MRRVNGKTRGRPGANARKRGPVVWTIVLIDQGPLRRKAAKECQREMKRLEKARADWQQFQQKDKPAFERWMAQTFGALMTEMREINTIINEKEALVEAVEAEMYMGRWPTYELAYRALERRRAQAEAIARSGARNQDDEGADPRNEEKTDDAEPPRMSEFEEELLFEEFVRTFMGMNPDRMSDSAYQKLFADFRANVLGAEGRKRDQEPEAETRHAGKKAPAAEPSSRLKELYRILVRRLHPDTKADSDAQVSALWHEVQQAYSDGNIERLEMLLAFTDLQTEAAGEHTTVSQMRAVLAEVRRSLHALLRSLSSAKRELAWNFGENQKRDVLEQKLRRQMERDIGMRKGQLQELEVFIASWSAPKRRRSSRRRPQDHAEFPF
jgi:hypothetical protein